MADHNNPEKSPEIVINEDELHRQGSLLLQILRDNQEKLMQNESIMRPIMDCVGRTMTLLDIHPVTYGVGRRLRPNVEGKCFDDGNCEVYVRAVFMSKRLMPIPIEIPVARTRLVDGETRLVPLGQFSETHAEFVSSLVDELLLAIMSGELPNLDRYELDAIEAIADVTL